MEIYHFPGQGQDLIAHCERFSLPDTVPGACLGGAGFGAFLRSAIGRKARPPGRTPGTEFRLSSPILPSIPMPLSLTRKSE